MHSSVGAEILGPNDIQADIQAISTCARINIECGVRFAFINIYSDSLAELSAISSEYIDSRLALECFTNVNKLALRNRVTLCWLSGQTGVPGSEFAEKLARWNSSTDFVLSEMYSGISRSTAGWLRSSH